MSRYTKKDIIRMTEEEDVEFIRLQFTDIFGMLKNVAITAGQLEKALNNRCMFDGSAIEGFVRLSLIHILWAAKRLKELGYMEVNLNLGCPSGTVVAKKRGSGFLEYPMELDEFLYQVSEGICGLGMDLSVKTRIGKTDPQEFEELLSIYNRYPLKNLIVHPRVQTDYYKNHPRMDAFDLAVRESRNPVFYNGDLFSREDIRNFRNQYPGVEAVMLGRGLLTNPSLTEETPFTAERIRAFHEDVLEGYRRAIPGDKNVLFKMKELWTYLGEAFEDSTKLMKKIRKAQKMEEYRAAVECLLAEKPVCAQPCFPGWKKQG